MLKYEVLAMFCQLTSFWSSLSSLFQSSLPLPSFSLFVEALKRIRRSQMKQERGCLDGIRIVSLIAAKHAEKIVSEPKEKGVRKRKDGSDTWRDRPTTPNEGYMCVQ